MNELIELTKKNVIDWEELKKKSIIDLIEESEVDLNVVIGFRGRPEFLKPIIESFNNAFLFYKNNSEDKKTFSLTFVEHDNKPYNYDNLKGKVNYIWSEGNVSELYNRSFAYNFAFKYSNKSKYYLFHDLDILVKKNYFLDLFENLKESKCMQSYGNRHVWYMSENLTKKFLNNEITLDEISRSHPEVTPPLGIGSKGGSILIERNTYSSVGGFDPELFWGYAAEDQMFWEKVNSFLGYITYADNPVIDIIHMWHPPSASSNPNLGFMDSLFYKYKSLPLDWKLKFCEFKSSLL